MAGYKEPGFQDRVKAAAEERAKALARLKAKPPVDPQVLAERASRAQKREAAQAEKRAGSKVEREAKLIGATNKSAVAPQESASPTPPLTEAERKAARDARYAARKARKK